MLTKHSGCLKTCSGSPNLANAQYFGMITAAADALQKLSQPSCIFADVPDTRAKRFRLPEALFTQSTGEFG
ncbi:MAG: hypothetical protein Q4E77_01910 [Conchiformibius sp.]|nr:hypothetical protein [Conchiformibius sp.]